MTTLPSLFTDEIYIKGKPLAVVNINNVTTINAVITGLTGGRPVNEIKPDPLIHTRPPTAQDDMNENWNVGDIWITSTKAYVCMSNVEMMAVWNICNLEIRDDDVSQVSTYSSNKIENDHKHTNEQTDYKLSLKANVNDMNVLLSAKLNKTQFTSALLSKADKSDTYTKSDTDNLLDLKADKSNTYTKQYIDTLESKRNNLLDLKADKSDTFTKQEVNSLMASKSNTGDCFLKAETYDRTTIDSKINANTSADTLWRNLMTITIADLEDAVNGRSLTSQTYTKQEVNSLIDQTRTTIDAKINANTSADDVWRNLMTTTIADLEDAVDSRALKSQTYTKQEVDDALEVQTTNHNTQEERINVSNQISANNTYSIFENRTQINETKSNLMFNYYNKTVIDTAMNTKQNIGVSYNKAEIDTAMNTKQNIGVSYNKAEIDAMFETILTSIEELDTQNTAQLTVNSSLFNTMSSVSGTLEDVALGFQRVAMFINDVIIPIIRALSPLAPLFSLF